MPSPLKNHQAPSEEQADEIFAWPSSEYLRVHHLYPSDGSAPVPAAGLSP
jgi:hypothetical protein